MANAKPSGFRHVVELKSFTPRCQLPIDVEPFHRWDFPDGTKWAEFYRTGTAFLLRFPGLADFEVAADGGDVICFRSPSISQSTADHLFINQVLPLALSLQGKLVFHASAVNLAGRAIAFLGESGRGKSTLAAFFTINGHSFLTDDGLVLDCDGDSYLALPSHPSIRLWADSRDSLLSGHTDFAEPVDYSSKSRLLIGNKLAHCEEPRPIQTAYVLGDGSTERLIIRRLSEAETLIAWARHSFVVDVEDSARIGLSFDRLATLSNTIPCYWLDYPRDFDNLPNVLDAIINHATSKEPA